MHKILIVDDEENIRKVIKEYVEFERHTAYEAENRNESIRNVQNSRF